MNLRKGRKEMRAKFHIVHEVKEPIKHRKLPESTTTWMFPSCRTRLVHEYVWTDVSAGEQHAMAALQHAYPTAIVIEGCDSSWGAVSTERVAMGKVRDVGSFDTSIIDPGAKGPRARFQMRDEVKRDEMQVWRLRRKNSKIQTVGV